MHPPAGAPGPNVTAAARRAASPRPDPLAFRGSPPQAPVTAGHLRRRSRRGRSAPGRCHRTVAVWPHRGRGFLERERSWSHGWGGFQSLSKALRPAGVTPRRRSLIRGDDGSVRTRRPRMRLPHGSHRTGQVARAESGDCIGRPVPQPSYSPSPYAASTGRRPPNADATASIKNSVPASVTKLRMRNRSARPANATATLRGLIADS
jgi:hypothetical protein